MGSERPTLESLLLSFVVVNLVLSFDDIYFSLTFLTKNLFFILIVFYILQFFRIIRCHKFQKSISKMTQNRSGVLLSIGFLSNHY